MNQINTHNQCHQCMLSSMQSTSIQVFGQKYSLGVFKGLFILYAYKGIYNLLLSSRLLNQNAKMENSIQNLLKDFYFVAIQNHPNKQEKIRTLDSCFSKFGNTFKSTFENTKSNADGQFETQASIEDFEAFSFNRQLTHIYSSNMLRTYLLSNCSNYTPNNCKVISKNIFTDHSIIKVIIYALFINLLHINKKANSIQNRNHLNYSVRFAQQTIKKLKIAMVSAAQAYKNTDRKKYAKIRYLYDQLINYTQKSCNLKEEYIKVIIEQFENDFLEQTFKCLESKWDQLLYSQSLCSIASSDSISREKGSLQEIDRALEYLQVNMVLLKDQVQVDDSYFNKNLNIVVEEMPNGAFKLNEIISIRSSQSIIS